MFERVTAIVDRFGVALASGCGALLAVVLFLQLSK